MQKLDLICEKRWHGNRLQTGKLHCQAYTIEPADKSLCWTGDPEWKQKFREAAKKYWLEYYGRAGNPK